ncbi:MAG: hypothetical protein QXU92_04385 [Candidatus Diapherotrites archaeon]
MNKVFRVFGIMALSLAFILPMALGATVDQITIDNKLHWIGGGTIQRVDSNAIFGIMNFTKANMSLVLPSKNAQLSPIGTYFMQYQATYNDAVLSINDNNPVDCDADAKFHGTASYVSLPNQVNKFVVFMGVVSVTPKTCNVAPFSFVVTGKGTSFEQ